MRITRLISNLYVRFGIIFVVSFTAFFFVINGRFVTANFEYWINPNSLYDPRGITPLPLSENLIDKPLPASATLVIDKLRVEAPIVFQVPADNDTIFNSLESGVVHYSITPRPGERGTAVILGHSSAYPWYKGNYGSVFALLSKLSPGDRFQVRYSDGRVFTFEMKKSLVFNPIENDSRLSELEIGSRPAVVLVSCWPVGTDYRRLAVRAELIE